MALRFNPPPNWPAPPQGFTPPAGWQPDPSWGPAPEGWELWVDDAAGAPVASPTGQSASAPSGDYASAAPVAGSASSASPYAANMDYAQSPTPYHSQGQQPGAVPQQPGWQPVDVATANGGKQPLFKKWWFWAIAGLAVLLLFVGGLIAVFSGSGDDSSSSKKDSSSSSQTHKPSSDKSTSASDDATASDHASADNSGKQGYSMDNPADPTQHTLVMKASEYSTDPKASMEVQFGEVQWNADESLNTEENKYSYEAPPAGSHYVRVPVTVTYHGKEQMSSFDPKIDYVKDGNTISSEYMFVKDELSSQDMPRDGGTATGYVTFVIPEADAHSGVWAVSAFYGDEMYMAAK